MKRFWALIFATAFMAVLFAVPVMAVEVHRGPQIFTNKVDTKDDVDFGGGSRTDPSEIDIEEWSHLDIESGATLEIKGGGTFMGTDSSGTVDTYVPGDRVVLIDSYDDLSTWSGAGSGQSYFQCSPGRTYLVDPYAIVATANGLGGAPGGVTIIQGFSGVSAILPDAATWSGPAYDVTIAVAVTGNTGFDHMKTGGTNVQVWPYPGSGATTYYANATESPQSMLVTFPGYVADSGTSRYYYTTYRLTSGGSNWELNMPMEAITFRLDDSSVSAYPVNRHMYFGADNIP